MRSTGSRAAACRCRARRRGRAAARPKPRAGAPSVRVHGLHFSHAGEDAFFEDYDLRVAAGEHVALMGPSGSRQDGACCA